MKKSEQESKYYVGLVVANNSNQILLGKRREDGIWSGPGGGSDEGETPEDTAVREAFEEAQIEIDKDYLIPLDTIIAKNGKSVFCFLYITGQLTTSAKLDPDTEVPMWDWYSQEDIPEDIIKDSNRHTAVMNGLMTLKGLKKGGQGSGKRGHKTSRPADIRSGISFPASSLKMMDNGNLKSMPANYKEVRLTFTVDYEDGKNVYRSMIFRPGKTTINPGDSYNSFNEAILATKTYVDKNINKLKSKKIKKSQLIDLNELLKAKKMPIGTIHNGKEKVAEGKWVPVKAGKQSLKDDQTDYQDQHNKDEASRHMDEALKHKNLNEKLKAEVKKRKEIDPNYETPQAVDEKLQETEEKVKAHAEDHTDKKIASDNSKTVKQLKEHEKDLKNQIGDLKSKIAGIDKKEKEVSDLTERHAAAKEKTDDANKKVDASKNRLKELQAKLDKFKKSNKFIAMQDKERKEQFKADKPKQGKTTSDKEENIENIEKGGPGSGPSKGNHVIPAIISQEAQAIRRSLGNWQHQYDKTKSEQSKKMVELFTQKLKDFVKKNKLKKSIVGEFDGKAAVAIGTTDYTAAAEAAQDWLSTFQNTMENFNYGDIPRTIFLDGGYSIIMSKVDDGVYSGFVKQSIDRDGESLLEENVCKVERQTMPELIQYLKAREYIRNVEKESDEVPERESKVLELQEALSVGPVPYCAPEINNLELKTRFLEQLNQLLNN